MVGLLLFGVALGPHVLGFFGEHRPIADFFAELGKLLLMFSAGLEIDIALFYRAQKRSIICGVFTTTVPLVFGTFLGPGAADQQFRSRRITRKIGNPGMANLRALELPHSRRSATRLRKAQAMPRATMPRITCAAPFRSCRRYAAP
jgi:hypothetical protein